MKKTSLVLAMVLGLFMMLTLFAQAQPPLKLSCSLGEHTFIVNIDFTSKKVNGFSASFSEDQISWLETIPNVANIAYYINRYTGDIEQQDYRGIGNEVRRYGKCHKVSEREF
jgi:hypothetical protein